MHEVAQKFIEKKKEEAKKQKEQEIREFLMENGLFGEEKEYAPDSGDDLLSYRFWDEKAQRYYRYATIDVSEDEYNELRKYGKDITTQKEKNIVSTLIAIIAFTLYGAGFILGCFLGGYLSYDFDLLVALCCWISGFVFGTIFLGFAEIIKLLHNINNKIK